MPCIEKFTGLGKTSTHTGKGTRFMDIEHRHENTYLQHLLIKTFFGHFSR
jgi:hypothetical protein